MDWYNGWISPNLWKVGFSNFRPWRRFYCLRTFKNILTIKKECNNIMGNKNEGERMVQLKNLYSSVHIHALVLLVPESRKTPCYHHLKCVIGCRAFSVSGRRVAGLTKIGPGCEIKKFASFWNRRLNVLKTMHMPWKLNTNAIDVAKKLKWRF